MTRHTLKISGARKVLEHLGSFQKPDATSHNAAA